MADYKDITTSYSRQFRRPDDARREAEREQWKADLQAHEPLEPEEMPTAIYNKAFQAELEKYAAEDATEAGEQRVDDAITSVVADADARVEAASLTPEQRQARAFVDELERRGTVAKEALRRKEDEAERVMELVQKERGRFGDFMAQNPKRNYELAREAVNLIRYGPLFQNADQPCPSTAVSKLKLGCAASLLS